MATYTNNVSSENLTTSIGSPTLQDGDSVILSEASPDYTAGLDLTAAALAAFEVRRSYTRNLGAIGSPVRIKTNSTGVAKINGAGNQFVLASTNSTTLINLLDFDPALGAAFAYLSDCDCTKLIARGGIARLYDTAKLATLSAVGGRVAIDKNDAYTVTTVRATGQAKVELARKATTIEIGDLAEVNAVDANLAPTTVNLWGGRLKFRGLSIATLNAYSGELDLTDVRVPLAVTTSNFRGRVIVRMSQQTPAPSWGTQNWDVAPQIVYV